MVSRLANKDKANMDIKIKDNLLSKSNNTKFLAVTIDSRLTWESHSYQLCSKVSQMIGISYKIRNNITVDCLKLIYKSTVYPLLIYYSTVWV